MLRPAHGSARMSTVRRQINIDASPRTIWKFLTAPEELARWLGTEARVDPRAGGRYCLKVGGQEEVGMLHEFRPTGRLEVLWDKHSPGPWKGTRVLFQVARDGAESVVHIQHINPAFEDAALRAPIDAFWKETLLKLRESLESA